MSTTTHQERLAAKQEALQPVLYGKTRNYTAGQVSELGPYVSRGVTDTRSIWEFLVSKGYSFEEMYPFVQQLAWRDFFQRVWQRLGQGIHEDVRNRQQGVLHFNIPSGIVLGNTGIHTIGAGIANLRTTGFMHNHLRMYTAFLACNLGGAHWHTPAQWMYSLLLDGDWGSNALSWQWVAGTFSGKRYIANQDNINRYTSTDQRGTYLDISYEKLAVADTPEELKPQIPLSFKTQLPEPVALRLGPNLPVLVYNYYNLSPHWRVGEPANRVLLLEPDVFASYPVAEHCIRFALELAREIPGMRVWVGSFNELAAQAERSAIIFREHPLNQHYRGTEDPRAWLADEVIGDFQSFFSYWKKVEVALRLEYREKVDK